MQEADKAGAVAQASTRKKRQRRGPDEGNILWKLYTQLGRIRLKEFFALLAANNITRLTFTSQTARTYRISRMRAGTLQLYRDFFLESGVDLNDYVAAELAEEAKKEPQGSQQFEERG